jgi:cystathionine beta-lyase/cystathionine gamma-synthase
VRLLREVLAGLGVSASFVDTTAPQAVAAALTPRTRLVFVETPANPTLVLTDIAAVAAVCRQADVPLAVDNTFLTPVLQRPLDLGADISVYSTTKHIEGHNSTVGGALTSRDEALLERLRFIRKCVGSIQSPFESWLTLRGIKTLPLRLRQHSAHAQAVASWLEPHPRVTRVLYPGLSSFPQHELAIRQQRAHGGILAFEIEGGLETGTALMNSVRLCALAENLGAVETLITHPASMTHADVPRQQRERTGVTDGLVRLSVGLEDPADIIADLAQAIEAAGVVAAEGGLCQAAR